MSATLQVRLANLIIAEHFGPLSQLVANVLLERGRQTIHDVFMATKLKLKPIREILLSLIHHHLVGFMEEVIRGRTITYYTISPENVILRLYFPRFIEFSRNAYGTEAELLVTEMIKNGRMTLDGLVDEVCSAKTHRGLGSKPITPESMKETFSILVHNRVFMRMEPAVNRKSAAATPKTRPGAGRGAARIGAKGGVASSSQPEVKSEDSLSASAVEMLHPLARKRKQAAEAADGEKSAKMSKPGETIIGQVGGVQAPSQAKGPAQAQAEVVVWRLNVVEFLKQLRHQEIIKYIEKKFDKDAATVARAMLLLSSSQEKTKNDPTSSPITFQALISTMPGDASKEQLLETVLETLRNDSSGVLTKLNDIRRGTFLLNHARICELVKEEMVESIIVDKFGLYSCRIYRLLRMKKQLERKQISDMGMIPQKEAFQLLYALYQDGIVSMQEIPKSSMREPARTFYCWSVKESKVFGLMKERFLKALYNSKTVANNLLRDNKEFIEKAKNGSLVTSERQKLQKLQHSLNACELSALRMADAVMLMEDF